MNSQEIEFTRLRHLADRLATTDNQPALSTKQRPDLFLHTGNKPLKSPEPIEVIAQRILRLFSQDDTANAQMLIENIAEGTLSPSLAVREQSLISLSLLCEKALSENHKKMLSIISHSFVKWLEQETEFISGYEFICSQLATCLEKLLSMGCFLLVLHLTLPIKDIITGANKKQKIQRRIVARIFERVTQIQYLKKITNSYLSRESEQTQAAKRLLQAYGSKSTPFLLETLEKSPLKEDRFMLLELLQSQGQEAIPQMLGCLHSKPPWYLIRNIILLMSALKDESLYSHVKPYLDHEDIRVQQEAVHFLATIHVNNRTDRLLEAVTICGDETKPQIIQMLSPLKETRVHSTMQNILKNVETYNPKYREKIISATGSYILNYPDNSGKDFLEELLAGNNSTGGLQETSRAAIKKLFTAPCEAPFKPYPVNSKPAVQTDKERPDKIRLVKNHINQHSSLYNALSQEECKTLYRSFTTKTWKANDIIVKKGDVHSFLYFVEQGTVSLDFEEEITAEISPLKQGDIFGYEVFMDGSEWPVTLRAAEHSTLFLFDQEELLRLQQTNEHIRSTFINYCRQKDCIISLYRNTRFCLPQPEKPVIPFNDSTGELISTVTPSDPFSNGMACCFHLPEGIDYSLFANRRFSVTFIHNKQNTVKVNGYTAGLIFAEQPERVLRIMVKFTTRILTQITDLQCSAISLIN